MFKVIVISWLAILTINVSARSGKRFADLKEELTRAELVELDVLIIIKSNIFGNVDSTKGRIVIADDSRYCAFLNDDIFWFDGDCINEYIAENNQVTRDCLKDGEYFESELLFIKNLDRHYRTAEIKTDSLYSLKKIDSLAVSLPDSLKVIFTQNDPVIPILEYYDLNNDLNIVIINRRLMLDSIPPDVFNPIIPDSVEVIILP